MEMHMLKSLTRISTMVADYLLRFKRKVIWGYWTQTTLQFCFQQTPSFVCVQLNGFTALMPDIGIGGEFFIIQIIDFYSHVFIAEDHLITL